MAKKETIKKERGEGPLTVPQQQFLQEAQRAVSSAHTAVEALKFALGLDPEEVKRLREEVDRLDKANTDLAASNRSMEAELAELEDCRDTLPDGVTALRDGTYETDEKIRLFARKISKRTLVELERMF